MAIMKLNWNSKSCGGGWGEEGEGRLWLGSSQQPLMGGRGGGGVQVTSLPVDCKVPM